MKLLHFIKEITDSEEEFLAVIKELNEWVEDNENRSIYVPHNVGRCGFSRDEWSSALDRAVKAVRRQQAHQHDKQNLSEHRARKGTSNTPLLW